jgi:transposase
MRKLNRSIFDLQEDITYYTNKLDAALQRCGFRLSNYVSRITGKSYRKVVAALASSGVTDSNELIKCVHGRIINKHRRDYRKYVGMSGDEKGVVFLYAALVKLAAEFSSRFCM